MKKEIYFPDFKIVAWPESERLRDYFLTPRGRDRTVENGNDSWGLDVKGLYGTENVKPYVQQTPEERAKVVEASLDMDFNPQLGVLLSYSRYGGGFAENYFSYSDLGRLNVYVETLHNDLRPVGMYIPHQVAWPAVKEFMDREGELPTCINWVSGRDLPENTFVEPGEDVPTIKTTGYPWDRDPNWRSSRKRPR